MLSSTKIALITSSLIVSFNLILLILRTNLEVSFLLLYNLIIFSFSFIIIKYSFKGFINYKIKPIFNTIYGNEQAVKENYSLEKIERDALILQQTKDDNIVNLQQQINFKKEFLGNISHELKTPIFSAQGYIDTLIDGGLEDDNINLAYLNKASKNIERLSNIVNDIDIISKIESNAINLKKTSFSISELIKESIESLELLADRNDIEVVLEPNSRNYNVFADRDKIKEVLINLISNSLKYGKDKGQTKLAIFNIRDKILVRISDNGLGIKEEQLPRIFERFYRIDDNRSRQQGGSGLGLAIVKHIVEAHKQTVSVNSKYGKGSTFEFTLDKS